MNFTIPGLMPQNPILFLQDLTVKMRGIIDTKLRLTLLEDDLPYDLAGKVFKLFVTDNEDGVHEIEGAVTLITPDEGVLEILFGEAARVYVGEQDGNHKWLLVEETEDGDVIHREGWVFRKTFTEA